MQPNASLSQKGTPLTNQRNWEGDLYMSGNVTGTRNACIFLVKPTADHGVAMQRVTVGREWTKR